MNIHFIGIGGIGVSALAQYYLAKGHRVSGSDLARSEITDFLRKKGARIFIGIHKTSNVPSRVDLVIYSPAVAKNNPELKKAREEGIKYLSYPEALGELTKKYFTVAVSGTHGKSTTTAMVSLILIKAGLNPTVVLGTKLQEFKNSNFRPGKSNYLVIEADEWQASFLNYWPKLIVLTNIEKEHLDYYKNLEHILRTYREYIGHLPKDGTLAANGNDKNVKTILNPKSKIQNFFLEQKEARKLKKILKIPGEHNVANALAALTVARVLKIPDKVSFDALAQYQGSWRRFEEKDLKMKNLKLKIISDYGHHPTEIKATLKAAREKYPRKEIWCCFQPHQYQRTFYLFEEFVKVFRELVRNKNGSALCNKLIITDIFDVAGRENKEIKKKVSAEKLAKIVSLPEKIIYLPKHKIIDYLKGHLRGGEVIVMMGAGDIYGLVGEFEKSSQQQHLTSTC